MRVKGGEKWEKNQSCSNYGMADFRWPVTAKISAIEFHGAVIGTTICKWLKLGKPWLFPCDNGKASRVNFGRTASPTLE